MVRVQPEADDIASYQNWKTNGGRLRTI